MLTLKKQLIQTPLGMMTAISDDNVLYLLDFIDGLNLSNKIKKLQITLKADIFDYMSDPIDQIQKELNDYFDGKLKKFNTKISLTGTKFQKDSWNALLKVPYGQIISYKDQAIILKDKNKARAVGTSNSKNNLAIIIPCHRVINANGELGGYSSGILRKKYLIEHEKNNI